MPSPLPSPGRLGGEEGLEGPGPHPLVHADAVVPHASGRRSYPGSAPAGGRATSTRRTSSGSVPPRGIASRALVARLSTICSMAPASASTLTAFRSRAKTDLDVGREQAAQRAEQVLHHAPEVEHLVGERSVAAEGEQLADHLRAAAGGGLQLAEVARAGPRAPAGSAPAIISLLASTTVSRLLRSWAMPPVSWPTASIFCAWRSCSSSRRRSEMSRTMAWNRPSPRSRALISTSTVPPPFRRSRRSESTERPSSRSRSRSGLRSRSSRRDEVLHPPPGDLLPADSPASPRPGRSTSRIDALAVAHHDGIGGLLQRAAVVRLGLHQLPLGPHPVGDVVDDREQGRAAIEDDGTGVHLDVAHLPRSAAGARKTKKLRRSATAALDQRRAAPLREHVDLRPSACRSAPRATSRRTAPRRDSRRPAWWSRTSTSRQTEVVFSKIWR